jgi:hypothetical protein
MGSLQLWVADTAAGIQHVLYRRPYPAPQLERSTSGKY